jgi:photosystem II stability/assembly factor-like uncharacterized protein
VIPFDAQHLIVCTMVEGASIWETFDAGASWDTLAWSQAGGFNDLQRLGDGTLIACSDIGDLMRSTDGGQHWTNATQAIGGDRVTITAMTIVPHGRAFAAGTYSGSPPLWLASDDGGATWQSEPVPMDGFEKIAFASTQVGVVGGDFGKIARTTDGGHLWKSAPLDDATLTVYDLAAPEAGTMFAATFGPGGKGTVFRSRDQGASLAAREQRLAEPALRRARVRR